jgi:ubiquinone/menaquinone biosynthesis C-methylase UbiE
LPKKATGLAEGYLHGYSPEEQERLYQQARFLESKLYRNIDFAHSKKILEIGSGVGAQTEILLERFPRAKVYGVDSSSAQIKRAKEHLAPQIHSQSVSFRVADALKLPFKSRSFDGAFVCWFLEHVRDPIGILSEARRVLKPGAPIYCSEVLNATFFVHPYSPATLQYWFQFNDHQWSLKGDPFLGAKLANYLLASGYKNVTTRSMVHHYDNRRPKMRARFIEYWTHLLLSGAPSLIKARKVTTNLVEQMTEELERLKNDPDSVFYYTWIQARAEAK